MSIKIKIPRVSQLTCDQLNSNGNLSFAKRQDTQAVNTWKTGQIVSYRTGDDGDLELGRGASFTGLTCNNPFGNTNRFTDTLGGQTYANDLILDWETGLMWYRIPSAVGCCNWNSAIDGSNNATTAGYTDWFLPNVLQIWDIINYNTGQQNALNYHPFNISVPNVASRIWTSTTCTTNVTTNAFSLTEVNNNVVATAKTVACRYIYCRFFTLSELGF